jgi:hypothetical protein
MDENSPSLLPFHSVSSSVSLPALSSLIDVFQYLGHPVGQFLVNFNSDAIHSILVLTILFAWSSCNQFMVALSAS